MNHNDTSLQTPDEIKPVQKIDLLGMDKQAMEAFFVSIGEKPFRAGQIMKWIHQFGISEFE